MQFKSDGSMRRLSIDGPNAGDWYAVAFISWTDPNNDRIEQQGKQFCHKSLHFRCISLCYVCADTRVRLVNLPDSQTHKSVNDFPCTRAQVHSSVHKTLLFAFNYHAHTRCVLSTSFTQYILYVLYTKANVLLFVCRFIQNETLR